MTETFDDDRERPAKGAVVPLAATFGVQTMASLSMFAVAVLAPAAAPDIGVDTKLVGAFTAIAHLFGMAAGLMTGAFIRRFGAIRVCQSTMVFAALGLAALIMATPAAAVLAAVLLGFCYGPVNPTSTDILARVSPARWRPLFFSIKQTGMPAGAALAGVLLPVIVLIQGWQAALAVTGIMVLAVALLVQPLRRRLDTDRDAAAPIRAGGIAEPLKLVWRTPALRHLAVVAFSFAGTQVALATLYVVFLTSALALALTTAGGIYAILQTGAIIGRLLWGWLADRHLPAIRLLSALGLTMGAATVVGGMMAPDWPLWLVGAISFIIGLTTHGWNGIFLAEVVKHAPADRMADASGGIQFANLAGVACGPPLFALIVATSGAYLPAFLAAAAVMMAAGLFLKLKFEGGRASRV